jgi:ribosomal protein S18 acetylase RimI-like enzyme
MTFDSLGAKYKRARVVVMGCRTAETRDLPQLLALYRQLSPEDPELDPVTAQANWEALLGSGMTHVVVAEVDDELVASCMLIVVPNLTRGGRPFAVIENVVTHATHRRRGHGRAVLASACERAWAANCYKVVLTTARNDEGVLRFYEAAGFDRGTRTCFQMRRI